MIIRIHFLADYPNRIAAVANWLEETWGDVRPPHTPNDWWNFACHHARHSNLPVAYVAHAGSEFLGAATLDCQPPVPALDTWPGAWLSGLFIDPDRASTRVAEELLEKVRQTAGVFGHRELYTVRRVASPRYEFERHGWKVAGKAPLGGREVRVFVTDTDSL